MLRYRTRLVPTLSLLLLHDVVWHNNSSSIGYLDGIIYRWCSFLPCYKQARRTMWQLLCAANAWRSFSLFARRTGCLFAFSDSENYVSIVEHCFLVQNQIWMRIIVVVVMTFWPCAIGTCNHVDFKECYLVDPASSHMLVSKIKPCMCKYELIQTVKLRMAH